jgi:RNA polymerase sigma-70 factor (ECF subfamily)
MASGDVLPAGSARFPTTAWTCLRAAQDRTHPEHRAAVDRFVTLYWKPVFYFLRARQVPYHEAEDLTQDLLTRFLEKALVGKADPAKGRFRSFLLGVLKHMLADQRPGRLSHQKRFERAVISIQGLMTDEERAYEPSTSETPEEVFDRKWAATVWESVLGDLRERLVDEGHQAWYEIFMAYHAPQGKRPSQEGLATQFGLSRDEVRKVILPRVENRLDRLLRIELRAQGVPEAEIDDEIRELKRLLDRDG